MIVEIHFIIFTPLTDQIDNSLDYIFVVKYFKIIITDKFVVNSSEEQGGSKLELWGTPNAYTYIKIDSRNTLMINLINIRKLGMPSG